MKQSNMILNPFNWKYIIDLISSINVVISNNLNLIITCQNKRCSYDNKNIRFKNCKNHLAAPSVGLRCSANIVRDTVPLR